MKVLRQSLRSSGPAVVVALLLLLLGAVWLTGVHHHEYAAGHSCSVCLTAHSPAVATIAVSGVVAPRAAAFRHADHARSLQDHFALGIAPSRAPPQA